MMQNAALLWHVSLLVPPERKALALGLVGLVRVGPVVVFSMFSGVVADVWNRRRMMLLTQTGAAVISLGLALLTFHGLSAVWPLYVLTALGASISTFDLPARQALVPTLVPREHLPNAISMNAIMFQTASVVGPALGGITIAAAGVGWVYVVNTLSFGCVIAALLMMRGVSGRPVREAHDPEHEVSWRAAREGLHFVFRSPLIRSTMLLDFFATFFSSASALLPIYAQDILRVGARGYGSLYAAPAVGALLMSAVMIPLTSRIKRRGPVLLWAIGGYGLATVVFGVSHWFWLTFFCLAMTGAMDTISMIIRNIVRQLETPDRLRGRMIGVNMVFFQGGPQLGELEAGFVANWLGPVFSVVSGGVGCLIATAWVAATTPALRHYHADSAETATASARIRSKSPDPV
jgi:MFS family permease